MYFKCKTCNVQALMGSADKKNVNQWYERKNFHLIIFLNEYKSPETAPNPSFLLNIVLEVMSKKQNENSLFRNTND
jgi:hypothetical protein